MPHAPTPPAFHCPACGQKHRADLSVLEGRPGAVMRLACANCGLALAIQLDAHHRPVCARDDIGAAADADGVDPSGEQASAAHEAAGAIEAEFAAGHAVGRYAVERAIGRGGSSTVYEAFDPTTNRAVALKVLAADASEAMRSRFLREIEVQANIRHPNIMPVFDRGTLPDGRPFFTMELLHVPWTLAEAVQERERGALRRHPTLTRLVDLETLVRDVLLPVADGIYVANVENGVIHRDLKPDNVLIDTQTGRPYVIDFGICHVLARETGFASKAIIPPTTEEEGIVGTPRFAAPEQVRGSVNARTDVWGLGALLHFSVSGQPPIAGAANITRAELRRRIEALEVTQQAAIASNDSRKATMCGEQLARLTKAGLRTLDDLFRDADGARYVSLPSSTPPALRAVIGKAMAPRPDDRYVNARQLGKELGAWIAGKRVRALTQAGGTASAMETARRALRAHLLTGVWVLVGLLLGLGVAYAIATPGARPPSTRLEDAEQDIERLKSDLGGLLRVAENLTVAEGGRVWATLDARATRIERSLGGEPDTPDVRAVRDQLAYVRRMFAPPRVRIDGAGALGLLARNRVTQVTSAVQPGDNQLPPGAYRVSSPQGWSFPVDVPLYIRSRQLASQDGPEPPWATIRLPAVAGEPPQGMTLVIGGRVLARDLPFRPPSRAASDVPAFFMDITEVTNEAYAQFLAGLPPRERKQRTPTVAFEHDPQEQGAASVIAGLEQVPVVGIRPEDAQAYAGWRARTTGGVVRLPYEAEWVLAAGAAEGHDLPNGARGERVEADFTAPLREAGRHAEDVCPYGVRGLLGNAREMVLSAAGDLEAGAVLVKGAGVGDDPDQGAIYLYRVQRAGERNATTGFRCVQELPPTASPR